jgi:hypothetical protein
VLADKVSVRFPEAAPLPGRPALDRLLLTIDASLVWNGSTYGSATTTSTVLPSYPDTTVLGNLQAGVPFNEVDARLRASLASAGYLTLAVDPRRVDQASRALAAVYGVRPVNLTDILLDAAQDLARESSVDWDFLLAVDALDPQHADRQTLDGFVGTALSTVLPGLLAAPEPLLLLDAAPLGRYRQQHWLADLANLATPRPAARWLLVPHRSSVGAPQLDGGVAVPLGADGFLTLAAEDVEELDRSLARGTTP